MSAKLVVPPDKKVYLAQETEIGEIRKKWVWYILFGIIPITDNSPGKLAEGCRKIKMKHYISFLNGVVNIFTFIFTVRTATLEVECIK